MNKRILLCGILLQAFLTQAQQMTATGSLTGPSVSFEKWLSLSQIGTVVLSPNGANIAYTVTSTDWKDNSYDAKIWVSRGTQTPFQCSNPRTMTKRKNIPCWSSSTAAPSPANISGAKTSRCRTNKTRRSTTLLIQNQTLPRQPFVVFHIARHLFCHFLSF